MNLPIFTVIIPHRNTPDLLIRAVNSIPNERNIQVIVVDNSSKPLDILFFKNIRSNILLLYSDPNKGAGGARNKGIENTLGNWLLFLDADDFFTANAFEFFYSASKVKHEIIYFKMKGCYSDTLMPANRGGAYITLVDNFISKTKNSTNNIRLEYDSPCAKMILFELVKRERILFDEVPAGNDVMFSTKIGLFAKSITAIDAFVYTATILVGSITNSINLQLVESRYLVAIRRNSLLKNKDKKINQRSTMNYIFLAKKFGLNHLIRFIWISIKYKNNIFIGYQNWFKTYVNLQHKVD